MKIENVIYKNKKRNQNFNIIINKYILITI